MSVKLTHLEKVYYPKEKITKGDIIKYYTLIAKKILPYLKNRPLVMRRFPNGIKGVSFVQKDAGKNVPKYAKTAKVKHADRTVDYLVAGDLKTLLYAVNLGSIELHPFNASLGHLDHPDYIVFDLDPISIDFDKVVETALLLHKLLDKIGAPNFCKTSGARGLHIYIPTKKKYSYDQVKKFASQIGRLAHQLLPAFTSLERSPSKRKKKIYIDTLQNRAAQTMIAAYSARAKPGATVSTPLAWKEVKKGLDPTKFTIKNVPARLKKGDPFKGIFSKGINLPSCMKKLEKLNKD